MSRAPDEVLAELGASLDAAWRAPRRPIRRRRAALLVALAMAVAGVSTAAATRTVFSSSPPVPELAPLAIDLGSGARQGVPWQLTVAHCGRPRGTVSLILSTPAGGAGSPCGAPVQPPATYYGRRAALTFGLLPPEAVRAELRLGGGHADVQPRALSERSLQAARLAPALRIYVTATPVGQAVTALTAFDAGGHVVLVCQERSCVRP
jgi:hypothetical protein